MTAPGSKCAIQAKAGLVGLSDAPQSRPYQTPHSAAILRATNLPLYRSGLQLRPVVLLGCNSRKKKNKGNQIGPASDSTQSSHLAGPASRIEAPMMNPARSLLLPPALGWGLLKRAKLQVPKPQHRHHCAWQYRVIGKVQDPIEIPSRCSDIQSARALCRFVISVPRIFGQTPLHDMGIYKWTPIPLSHLSHTLQHVLLIQPANVKIFQHLDVNIDKAFPEINLKPPRLVLHSVRRCRCQLQ